MHVVDLDREMDDVIPTGFSRASEFLFARMTAATVDAIAPAPGLRVLDVASGFGQDAIELRRRGCSVVAAEPSRRMTDIARQARAEDARRFPVWVRAWSDALPFAPDHFDVSFCKGALDHFDRPDVAIAEMARVTKPGGRVVLAIANFESLTCRFSRALDAFREGALRRPVRRGRCHYDAPSDHFTRYELPLMREQAGAHLRALRVTGVSLGWGIAAWNRVLARAPEPVAQTLLRGGDFLARRWPSGADVVVLTGEPY